MQNGYPVGEDLFPSCYFLTMKERLDGIDPCGGEGWMRFLIAETRRDTEQEVRFYQERLESPKSLHRDSKERSRASRFPDGS